MTAAAGPAPRRRRARRGWAPEIAHAIWLAHRQIAADLRGAACFVFAFVGAALPLMLLLALKSGSIGALVEDLISDPRNREVTPIGARAYDAAFFEALQARPDVAFVSPDTRNISARLALARKVGGRNSITGLALIPSAPGDPLLPEAAQTTTGRAPQAVGEIALSTPAARRLDVGVGDRIDTRMERRIEGALQSAAAELTVVAIVPPERLGVEAALAPLAFLEAVERFLDDAALAPEAWLSAAVLREDAPYASFRLYAREIDQVTGLVSAVEALGGQARPRSEEAALLVRLEQLLALLYALIAGCAALGFWLSLAASLRANAERQRAELGALRLMGAGPIVRGGATLWQSAVIVVAGLAVAAVIAWCLSAGVNSVLSDVAGGRDLMRLTFEHLAYFSAGGLAIAVTAALWSARVAVAVPAEEGFR